AVRSPVTDRGRDRYDLGAIQPPTVDEGRPDTAAAVAVACRATKPAVEPFALRKIIGVGFIGLIEREKDLRRRPRDPVRHQPDVIKGRCEWRVEPQLALFALTSAKRNGKHRDC